MSQSSEQLKQLHEELSHAVAAAARRRKMTTLTMSSLVVAIAGYLGFAYSQIAKVDAATIVALAEQQAAPYLDQPAEQWAGYIEAQAPQVIDSAAEVALTLPQTASQQLEAYVDRRVDQELPKLETQFNELVTSLLEVADAEIRAYSEDGKFTDDEAKVVLSHVVAQFEDSLNGEFEKIYADYAQIAEGVVDYLDNLSRDPEALDETQRLQHDILVSLMALTEKAKIRTTLVPTL